MRSHIAIAAALTRLYQFFIKIGYITEEEMKWPPHSAQDLDIALCEQAGFNGEATALLQLLPWTTSPMWFAADSNFVDYSNRAGVMEYRLPDLYEAPSEMNPYLPAWMVPIAIAANPRGEHYILDARNGTLLIGWSIELQKEGGLEPVDPVEYLNEECDKFERLDLIPTPEEILNREHWESLEGKDAETMYTKTKAALFAYGWPDSFRKEDFRRDIGGLWEGWENQFRLESYAQKMAEIMTNRTATMNLGGTASAGDGQRPDGEQEERGSAN